MGFLERLAKLAPISTWALFGAGVVATVMQLVYLAVLRFGWLSVNEHDQLMYIGILAIIQAMCPLAVVVSLSRARVAVRGPGGFSADVGSGVDPAAPSTVKVEVSQ